jgi:hypothetical protein
MRTIAVASLVLLFGSLAIMYIAQPTALLLAIGVIILAVGAGLAFLGKQREVLLLGSLALLLSIAAAGLIGEARWGATGALIIPLIWVLLLYAALSWAWNNTIDIPSGTVMVIRHPNGIRLREGPARIIPPLPSFERHIATMPTYELSSNFTVEHLNTRSLQNINGIALDVGYQIRLPLKLLANLPNRARVIEEMASETEQNPERAMLRTAFWERLLDRQIREVIDGLLRSAVYEHINRAVDGSNERNKLADEVETRLRESVQHWGITIHFLEIPSVTLDPEQIKRSKREYAIKREIEDAERAARIEAQKIEMMGKAQAQVQAHAIASWIKAIQDQGVNLAPEDIEQIVLNALEEMNEKYRRVELFTGMKKPQHPQQERAIGK